MPLRPQIHFFPLRARALFPVLLISACHHDAPENNKSAPQKNSRTAYDPNTEARQQDGFRQPQKLVDALSLKAGDTVADIGAGAGYLTLRLARAVGPTGHVVATDIDPRALAALARRAAAASLPQIEERRVSANDPGLEPARYDAILLSDVDHLLPDRAAYLKALLPALTTKGRVLVCNRERYHQAMRDALNTLNVEAQELPAGLPDQFVMSIAQRRTTP